MNVMGLRSAKMVDNIVNVFLAEQFWHVTRKNLQINQKRPSIRDSTSTQSIPTIYIFKFLCFKRGRSI